LIDYISASVAQLTACIKELQSKGYAIPDYPENPTTEEGFHSLIE
jgi:isocitrate dehydrogenase